MGEGGVVAIVQGLQDAGLAVTMLSRRCVDLSPSALSDVSANKPQTQSHMAVDTATETMCGQYQQPQELGYRSSYQLAHGTPSGSSPVRLPRYSNPGFQQFRVSYTTRSHDEEVFVDSLRKYPRVLPNRSQSADLIQRMLTHTQCKNSAKNSIIKRPKSIPSKEVSNFSQLDEIPTRDCGNTIQDVKSKYGYKRNVELIPVSTSNRKSKRDDDPAMYDYLKSNKKHKFKASEVRYLTNMKECIKERLRQICIEGATTTCPDIQRRYSQHRKQYHSAENCRKCTGCKETTVPASSSTEEQVSSTMSGERAKVNNILDFKNHKACFCDLPTPCECASKASRPILKSKTELLASEVDKHFQYVASEFQNVEAKKDLEKIIKEWFEEIPVYPNISENDKLKREEAMERLIETLDDLQKDDAYLTKAEKEIKKCLKTLPMWHPESKQDQDMFDTHLVNNLTKKLKCFTNPKNEFEDEISQWFYNISFTDVIDKEKVIDDLKNKLENIALNRSDNDEQYEETLKSEIINTLNELPIKGNGSKTAIINDLANNLVEKLAVLPFEKEALPNQYIQENVLDWIKDIQQFANNIHIDKDNEDNMLVNDLITKLNNLQNKNTDCMDQMSTEILNWLNSVEKQKKCEIDPHTKKMLTNQLIDKLFSNVKSPIESVKGFIEKWYRDNLANTKIDLLMNERDFELLAMKLSELQNVENVDIRQNRLRKEVNNWLRNLERDQNRYIDSEIRENLVNKLITMMNNETIKESKNKLNAAITQNIWDWLKSQPDFQQGTRSKYNDMVIEFSEKLQNIINEKSEFSNDDVKTELSNWLEKLIQTEGLKIDMKNKKLLEDRILNCISKSEKYLSTPESVNEEISTLVANVINSLAPLNKKDKERLVDLITEVLTRNLNSIHSLPTEELGLEIQTLLKQETNLLEKEIEKITDNLIDRVKSSIKHDFTDVQLNNDLRGNLHNHVNNILKDFPIQNKREVINKITDILGSASADGNNGGYEIIHDALINAGVKRDKAISITKNVLDTSNKLRNMFNKSRFETNYEPTSNGSMESLWKHKHMFMQRLEREITDFMEKVLSESSSFFRRKTSADLITSGPPDDSMNQYNRFKMPLIKTSTPKTSKSEERPFNLGIKQNAGENERVIQIKDIVMKWLNGLELNGIIDNEYKQDMANDIAIDLIDRQMYIQLSKTKTSGPEEVEHVRYQVFKWINKLPNAKKITIETIKIEALLKSLEDVHSVINEYQSDPSIVKDRTHISTQDTSEFFEENIYDTILSWINEFSELKPRNSHERQMIQNYISELSKKLNDILNLDPSKQEDSVENMCKKEIILFLKKWDRDRKNNEEFYQNTACELIKQLKGLPFFAKTLEENQEVRQEKSLNLDKKKAIIEAVQNWCQKLPLKQGAAYSDMKETVEELADAISKYLLITDINDVNTLMDNILHNLKKLPLQFDKENYKNLPNFTEKLIETLKGILNESENYVISTEEDTPIIKSTFKKPAEVMYDYIQEWCENLPIDVDSTLLNTEKEAIKQNVEAKLLKKIGELNLDQDIFNDDFLYEDILRDEIEQIFDELKKCKSLEQTLPNLKENLIQNIMKAKDGMKTDIAAYTYKQQLRDAISKTLSSIGLPVLNDSSFEVLKDNLADAFISLHYVTDDEKFKQNLKDKIFNEINKFCDDYLKRNPTSPLNTQQINQELYNALKKVPMPKDETMRREVEQIKMKDVVSDWFKELPISDNLTNLQKNKIISILAKRLQEIEEKTTFEPNIDVDDVMKHEILKWLKKFKFKSGEDINTKAVAEHLVNKLKSTKDSRRLSATVARKSISYMDLTNGMEGLNLPSKTLSKTRNVTNNIFEAPPSTLNAEDRALLQKIKKRTAYQNILSPSSQKDASVSPVPVAASIQTEENLPGNMYLGNNIAQNGSARNIIRDAEPPMSPQVVIKEYYWDPTLSHSGSISSATRSPETQTAKSIGQQANIPIGTPQVTTAAQTMPLPPNEKPPTSTQNSCLARLQQHRSQEVSTSTPTKKDSQVPLEEPGDKSCQPCRWRREEPENFDNLEAGPSKELEQADQNGNQVPDSRRELQNFRPNCWAPCQISESYWDNPCNQPSCRHRACNIARDSLCKRKRRNTDQYKSHTHTKCTIRPFQRPCQQSHKSCNAFIKHCPKCWDGFCPHPSYLYFKRD